MILYKLMSLKTGKTKFGVIYAYHAKTGEIVAFVVEMRGLKAWL